MARAVKEWVGKTDETPPPPRVKERILRAYGEKCAITGRAFQPGDKIEFDHIIALIRGGRNAESNIQPVLAEAHAPKTADDVRLKAKASRVFKKRWGLSKPRNVIDGSKASPYKKLMNGSVERR